MGRPLGRWRATDAYGISDFVSATPRALAALRQISDPPPPKKKARQHIHVHLPPAYGSAAAPRQRTHDQAASNTIRMKGRDQNGKNWNMLLTGPGADIEDIEGGQELSQSSGIVSDTASAAGYGTIDQVRSNPGERLASYQRTLDDFYRER
jgi:hypothetical protein